MADAPEPVARELTEAAPDPAPRWEVGPGGLEELARERSDLVYRSFSLLAGAAFALSAVYVFTVALGGAVAFWDSERWVLLLGALLVPLLAVPVALKFGARGPRRLAGTAALALAAFLAVPVGVGGLIAYPSHSPWLLPLWSLLLPLAAAGLGWAARARIQASEDTLTGKALATWAIYLSLFFGLCYLAYYTATFIAVRQQATQFADEWVGLVQQGELDRAFLLTIPPDRRPALNDGTRDALEVRFNSALNPETRLGQYSGFGHQGYVRMLRGPEGAQVQLVGVRDWNYKEGGYLVNLSYEVSTPNWSFPLEVTVLGREAAGKDAKGRQWHVKEDGTGVTRPAADTDQGKQLRNLYKSGSAFLSAADAAGWPRKLFENKYEAFHDTLPVADRAGARQLRSLLAATGPGPLATKSYEPLRRYQERRAKFFDGSLVSAEEKRFWAPPRYREDMVKEIKQMFAPGGENPNSFTEIRASAFEVPSWSREEGQLRLHYDMRIAVDKRYNDELKKLLVEGCLILGCDEAALETGQPPQWQVVRLLLIRGRSDEPPGPRPSKPAGRP